MKKITNKTKLVQGGVIYEPTEIDGVIYWTTGEEPTFADVHNFIKPCYYIFQGQVYKREYSHHVGSSKIVAAAQRIYDGIPVVNLECTCWNHESYECDVPCTQNINYYKSDLEKVYDLATQTKQVKRVYGTDEDDFVMVDRPLYTKDEVIEMINSIDQVVVDAQFYPLFIQ
jgi:hypothetical protein